MTKSIRLGISTCPNDTFAFHALLQGKISTCGLNFDIQLLDIQQLNERLAASHLDVAKASFYAGLGLTDSTVVLPCGAAIGFGVGPVLLSSRATDLASIAVRQNDSPLEIICPGASTTATFLCQTMLPFAVATRQVTFSEIIPLLAAGQAELGACIHEGRFVWREKGLHLIADLGEIWERQTSKPLPLGGLLAHSDIPESVLRQVSAIVRESIEYARANRSETVETMRRYAQEFDDKVLFAHVDLYVNDWTVDMGLQGREALSAMHEVAVRKGLIAGDVRSFRVLS